MKTDPAENAAEFLEALADGKYDRQIKAVQRILLLVGRVWPPAALVSKALSVFIWANKRGASRGGYAPDGFGGAVPRNNSRVHPVNGRFIRWHTDHWLYDDFMGGRVKEKLPPP